MDWTLFDVALATVLLGGAGVLCVQAARRPRSFVPLAAAVAIGIAAMALGEADDAPGLVLFGCLLIAGTFVLRTRAARRSG